MWEVMNLSSQVKVSYSSSITPIMAVICAHAQKDHNDFNTWDYHDKYIKEVVVNAQSVRCGDWTTIVSHDHDFLSTYLSKAEGGGCDILCRSNAVSAVIRNGCSRNEAEQLIRDLAIGLVKEIKIKETDWFLPCTITYFAQLITNSNGQIAGPSMQRKLL